MSLDKKLGFVQRHFSKTSEFEDLLGKSCRYDNFEFDCDF